MRRSCQAFALTAAVAAAGLLGPCLVPLAPAPAQADARADGEITVDHNARGSFSLVDHAGRPVTERDFRGRYLLVFFGYTSCPDVCPSDLRVIAAAMNALGAAGRRVQPVFITVDPERDTPAVLARYLGYFHPRLLGLTGTPAQVALAAQDFGVIYVKQAQPARRGPEPGRAADRIDHTALTYLLGPDARFLAAWAHNSDPKRLASDISRHLNAHSTPAGRKR